jgi:hypothetical protein
VSILGKIVPFYAVIEELLKVGGDVVREDQKRRTLRSEAEIKVYLATEAAKRHAEVDAWRERQAAETEVFKATEIDRIRRTNQIEFERHRVQLFERVRMLEIEIHHEMDRYELSNRKDLAEWGRRFQRMLEDEVEQVWTERVPRMIAQAKLFEDDVDLYAQYTTRIFTAADHITVSVSEDLAQFRADLAEMRKRPGQLAAALARLDRRLPLATSRELSAGETEDD